MPLDNDKPAALTVRRAIPACHLSWLIAVLAVFASLASYWLVISNATDEPYAVFRPEDALAQVGVGSALIAVWIFLSAAVLYGVITRSLSTWWLLLLLWITIVLFYLRLCPLGYVGDIARNMHHR
jgi:hypothetical protein